MTCRTVGHRTDPPYVIPGCFQQDPDVRSCVARSPAGHLSILGVWNAAQERCAGHREAGTSPAGGELKKPSKKSEFIGHENDGQ